MPASTAIKRHHFYDTDQAVVALEADRDDGTSTEWHWHSRAQLLYAIEGVMVVRSAAGIWVVPPNRALWITPNLEHEVTMVGKVKMRTVYINMDAITSLPQKTCVIRVSNLLKELLVAAVKIPRNYLEGTRDALVMQLLIDEIRISNELPLHLPTPEDARVKRICAALIDNPDNVRTIADWAVELEITSKTIHRLFLKETSMTFAQWSEQARLLYALKKIASGDKIIDIAIDCGYSSPSAFTAMFKRHFGAPPSSYYLDTGN
jgi:AraC-like DNA-binding protein/mannose-6-phosphate isomerase-like protein (cupin superfamily)